MLDLIIHGATPNAIVDETGLNVLKFDIKGVRDYVTKKSGGTKKVVYLRGENPRLEGTLSGEPIRNNGAYQGLCTVHPGVATTLLNLPNDTTVLGFAFTSTTKVIIKDPSITRQDDKEDEVTVPFEFWPGLANYSTATLVGAAPA